MPSPKKKLEDFAENELSVRLRSEVDTLKNQLSSSRKLLSSQTEKIDRLQAIADYSGRALSVPKWPTVKKPKPHSAIACAMLSDTHFDEVIRASEVGGINAFDRDIATMRLRKFFDGIEELSFHYLKGITYDGLVLFMGGDMISGEIHHELTETNEGTSLETVLYWTEQIAAGISSMADLFGKVHIPVVVGNHGRRTQKPISKRRARDNYDWLIGQMLARHFDSDKRISFQISDGVDALVPIYDSTFLLYHGETNGGGGIGGIFPPIMRLRARKSQRYQFETLVIGHWHQYVCAPGWPGADGDGGGAGIIVNGSLKGFDEYASTKSFAPERAQQAFWTVSPKTGVGFSAPIYVADRQKEGW